MIELFLFQSHGERERDDNVIRKRRIEVKNSKRRASIHNVQLNFSLIRSSFDYQFEKSFSS